jgi:hypothetical protein
MRDNKRDQHVRARGEDGVMPSLVEIVEHEHSPPEKTAPDVLAAFEKAKRQPLREAPDLMAAFDRATAIFRKGKQEQREGEGPEKHLPTPPHHHKVNDHDRER